jgi:hypothetical protein
METKFPPGYIQELFEELERRGEIRKTGEYREGRPVYVPTAKRAEEQDDLEEIIDLVKALTAERTEQMQKANPIPDDYIGRRLYILEMLAEMAEHYDIPISPNEIEKHVKLGLERLPDGKWDDACAPLTDAGAALMEAYEEERRQRDLAEAQGRKIATRPGRGKLKSRQ